MRFVLVLVVALAWFRPMPADACSCAAPGPPCEAMFTSTVFVGKVTNVVAQPQGMADTTFEVVRTLHSAFPLGPTVTIRHMTIGSMCGLSFTAGTTYVVYAGGGSAAALGVGACSRTHVWTKTDPDVAFAAQATKRTTALVEGTVVLEEKRKAGVTVRAAGTQIAAKTGADGAFKLAVPPGKYRLEVTNPDLRIWHDDVIEVDVPVAAACAHRTVTVSYDGRIEGTITDAAGKPVAGVPVGAVAKREADRRWRLSATTDARGHYMIHEVPAGTFRVGVSIPDYGGMDPQSPYPPTYYAKDIATARAGLVSNIDFALPAARPVRTFKGTVRQRSGAPAVKQPVSIVPAGQNRSTTALTDAAGAYTLTELDGMDVVINACGGAAAPGCSDARKVTADAVVDLAIP